MSTNESGIESEMQHPVEQLRQELDAIRDDVDVLRTRADASEAREVIARDRAAAFEELAVKDRLRIDDLEVRVDIDEQLIFELHETGVLRHDQVEQLQTALRTSRMIGEAIGIVMTRRVVTEDVAFTLLRQASNNTNRKLREIAEDIVLTGDAAALV